MAAEHGRATACDETPSSSPAADLQVLVEGLSRIKGKKGKGKGKVDDYQESEEEQAHTPSSTQLDRIEAMLVQLVQGQPVRQLPGMAGTAERRAERQASQEVEATVREHLEVGFAECRLESWVTDRGFGLATTVAAVAGETRTVFVHTRQLHGDPRVGMQVWVKAAPDTARPGRWRADEAYGTAAWEVRRRLAEATEAAELARLAARQAAAATQVAADRLLLVPPGLMLPEVTLLKHKGEEFEEKLAKDDPWRDADPWTAAIQQPQAARSQPWKQTLNEWSLDRLEELYKRKDHFRDWMVPSLRKDLLMCGPGTSG
jgi:hypothetical protein